MRLLLSVCFIAFTGQVLAVVTEPLNRAKVNNQEQIKPVKSLDNVVNFAEIQQTLKKAGNDAIAPSNNNFYLTYQAPQIWHTVSNNALSSLLPNHFAPEIINQTPALVNDTMDFSLADSANISAGYQFGRFSAETGLIHQINSVQSADRLYLKGSVKVLAREKFTLSVTAKLEAFNQNQVEPYATPFMRFGLNQNTDSFNSSLGITGHYSLTKKWSVIGSFTSSSFNTNNDNDALLDSNLAVIGTRYAF
jgi:hypothetical protein